MKVSSERDPESGELKIAMKGDLLSTNAQDRGEAIQEAIDAHPEAQTILLDLSLARMVDSVGLNLLLSLVSKLRDAEKSTRLRVTSPSVLRVLEFSRFDLVAEIDYRPRKQR